MPSKTINHPRFPPGTAVKAFPAEAADYWRTVEMVPPVEAGSADGVVAANGDVVLTAAAGPYLALGVVDEVQTVTVDATAGQFKLVYAGQTTTDIAFNASATTGGSSVRALLEALSNIAVGDVVVTGGPGDSGGTTPYSVKFTGALAGQNIAAMTVAAGTTPLSGGGATATVATGTQGAKAITGGLSWLRFTID